jgi:hypothetical protein
VKPPMRFSTGQIEALRLAAEPLRPSSRPAFLEAVASRLQGCTSLGDGQLWRVLMEL